jgi:hypothetical protein
MACIFPAIAYRIHVQRSPNTTGIPLRFWKKQALITALQMALLIGGTVLLLVGAMDVALVVIMVGLAVNLAARVKDKFWPINPLA